MPKIPDRWLKYTPIGKQILGTRLIAFKVPLRPSICENVPDDSTRLDVQKVLETVPRLGLVIDLTNTKRYYNPEDFRVRGVEHIKIMCPGHKLPKTGLRRQFRNIVNNFLENNIDNDKLIGVHCTHGVNRTGYLICDYMISDLCIMPQDAIQRFKEARGHPIERINYIKSLGSKESTEPDQQSTYPEYQSTYHDYQPTYDHRSNRRSRYNNFTNNSTPPTVDNWRSPDYIYQRNLNRRGSSDTSSFGIPTGNRNWRNGPLKSSTGYGFDRRPLPEIREPTTRFDRNNDNGKVNSRYRINRAQYPKYNERNITSNSSNASGNLKNSHIRFDILP